jgi:hypothetical protein
LEGSLRAVWMLSLRNDLVATASLPGCAGAREKRS